MPLVLKLNLAATLYLTGLIWFVQVVHYPLFAAIPEAKFPEYEAAHQRLTTYVVAPPMLLELGSALLLAWRPPEMLGAACAWFGLLLVLVIWSSTFGLQVPQHDVLRRGFDRRSHARLVKTNWIRTVGWSVRAGMLVWAIQ